MPSVPTDAPLVYDPYAYGIHEDPYPTYRRLRDEQPLYRNDDRGFWALSRHADVLAAFRDSERFSSAEGVSLDPAASGPHAHRVMSFLAMDPPRHGRMRGLVARAFTPRRVAGLEGRIRALTREHLAPALDGDAFDFVADLAGKVPMDVISELLGVPAADRAELRRNSDLVVHREDGVSDVPPAGVTAATDLIAYYVDLVAERRARVGATAGAAAADDLVSALCAAEVDGDRLSDEDITAFLFLMVVAGNETTIKLLAHAWYWAWRHPDERAKPWADPGRVADWVEETLRYDTSAQMLARVTTTDVEAHGRTIPAGERVLLLAGSANRDERAFPEPDRFDLDRGRAAASGPGAPAGIASFGVGRHFCLGAALARLEARVVLEELVDRVASYDVDEAGTSRVHSVNVRGFATFPTTVVPR